MDVAFSWLGKGWLLKPAPSQPKIANIGQWTAAPDADLLANAKKMVP